LNYHDIINHTSPNVTPRLKVYQNHTTPAIRPTVSPSQLLLSFLVPALCIPKGDPFVLAAAVFPAPFLALVVVVIVVTADVTVVVLVDCDESVDPTFSAAACDDSDDATDAAL